MKKILFCLIVMILVLVSVLLISNYVLENKKEDKKINTYHDFKTVLGKYTIKGTSKEIGKTTDDYDFETYYSSNTDIFKFLVNIKLKYHNEDITKKYKDYESYDSIEFFNKEFKYINNDNIVLLYVFDNKLYIEITLIDDSSCYDKNGKKINCDVDYKLLDKLKDDNKFNDTLSFEITKK